jgi:hypothetical protein
VAATSHRVSEKAAPKMQEELFRIDFDMMLKGSVFKRRRGTVRQFGVTVNGSTRLVTSGDVVDLDTYKALVAAGAIRPLPVRSPEAASQNSSFVDFTTIEDPED